LGVDGPVVAGALPEFDDVSLSFQVPLVRPPLPPPRPPGPPPPPRPPRAGGRPPLPLEPPPVLIPVLGGTGGEGEVFCGDCNTRGFPAVPLLFIPF